MELTISGIKEREKWESVGVSLPNYDIEAIRENTKESPEWVHFGAGNIFRGAYGKGGALYWNHCNGFI